MVRRTGEEKSFGGHVNWKGFSHNMVKIFHVVWRRGDGENAFQELCGKMMKEVLVTTQDVTKQAITSPPGFQNISETPD
jgi:hypothetical protein